VELAHSPLKFEKFHQGSNKGSKLNILQGIPSPDISFIELGPFRIHFYALFILAGMALAIWIAGRNGDGRSFFPWAALARRCY
jgi:hypothetical protein